ncbi:MAG: ABC transporter ATP-binding protein [Erysipelotrichaceae bacterium]|nr:ABC transporter ATP-binding protein [Erysipelotrichaceae bacterium]
MIEINNLKKVLGDRVILDNLNLKINSGSIFGLVGINGAGKSTLLRCVTGIFKPEEGNVLINGEEVYDNSYIKSKIFFVNDEFYFERNDTINKIRDMYKMFYDFDDQAYFKYLNLFKLDPSKHINNYSKGMKRQVSLLMALSIKPQVLLLDEAFDGLDPLIRLNFKKALGMLVEEGSTIIISSHNLKELEDICDSFGILDDSHIKTSGQIADNLDNIHKYQVAFNEFKVVEDFKDFEVINFSSIGRVNTLVIKGDKEVIMEKLTALNPLLLEVLDIDFEELFIFEVEGGNNNV